MTEAIEGARERTRERIQSLLHRAQEAFNRMRPKNPHRNLIGELSSTIVALVKAYDALAEQHAMLIEKRSDRRIVLPDEVGAHGNGSVLLS